MEEYFPGILREICVALPLIGFVSLFMVKGEYGCTKVYNLNSISLSQVFQYVQGQGKYVQGKRAGCEELELQYE